jgi:hypothetical protein
VIATSCAALGAFTSLDVLAGLGAAVGVALWHLLLVRLLRSDRRAAALALDIPAMAVACWSYQFLLPSEYWYGGAGWVVALTSAAVLSGPWCLPPLVGLGYAATVPVTFLVTPLTRVDGAVAEAWPHASWLMVQGVVSWALVRLVMRGARQADEVASAEAAVNGAALVATARRREALLDAAILHDTVAATLTAACSPALTGAAEVVITEQASRDLRLLERGLRDDDRLADPALAVAMDDVVHTMPRDAGITVHVDLADGLPIVPRPVAEAFAGAAREALLNVERHAGVAEADLRATLSSDGAIRVVVADGGRGFVRCDSSRHRLGLSLSVEERMRRVGGVACIESAPGRGTTVTLLWPSPAEADCD